VHVRLKGRQHLEQTYQTIVGKNLYVVHRRAQLLGYLPPHAPYGLITVGLYSEGIFGRLICNIKS